MTTKTLIEFDAPTWFGIGCAVEIRVTSPDGAVNICYAFPPARAVGDDARQVLEQCNRFLSNYDGENVWDMQRKIRALLAAQPVDGDPPIDWKRRAEIAEAKLLRLKASGIRPPVGFGDFVPVDALLAAAPTGVEQE